MSDRERRRPSKPKREPYNDDLFMKMVGRDIRVDFSDGAQLRGKLTYVTRYEIQLSYKDAQNEDRVAVVPKHAVACVSSKRERRG